MADEQGYLIERYYNGRLHYWNGRPRDSGWANSSDAINPDNGAWTEKVDDAVWFADAGSASVVLSWCLGGVGRAAEHAMVSAADVQAQPRTKQTTAAEES